GLAGAVADALDAVGFQLAFALDVAPNFFGAVLRELLVYGGVALAIGVARDAEAERRVVYQEQRDAGKLLFDREGVGALDEHGVVRALH
nr:hypothetical protein [Tanacetum cinerariifolium]